jgi:glycosyltransferase involved in cell wall biosynthesis
MRALHPAVLQDLRRVSSAILLYQRDLDFFENHVGRGRVKFVRHGVDTEFFRPPSFQPDESSRRLLFVGINGRNHAMLARVVQRLCRSHPKLRFDMLVPGFREKPREALRLASLWRNPKVTWHSGIGDTALRRLYQTSYLLLLPLQHAGVCNAVVEALACGLPVVTTDVGGLRDYGAGTIYPVVPNDDDKAMIDLIGDYLASPIWRGQIASSCRQYTDATLSWSKSRQAHLQAYLELAGYSARSEKDRFVESLRDQIP